MGRIMLMLLEYEWIWKLKYKITHFFFLIKKNIYQIFEKSKNIKSSYQISLFFWKNTFLLLLKAIVVCTILLLIDNLLLQNVFVDSPLKNLICIIFSDQIQDKIFTLLTIIVSIAGLLLGLFYPLLGTIASTAYSKVRADIRNILLSEPYSQYFVRRLASLASITILILFSSIIGFKTGIFTLFFVVFLIIRAIYSTITIGLGIFNYFDPSNLINAVVKDLYETTLNVTIKGKYWKDQKFQFSYQQYGEKTLEKVFIILDLCTHEKHLQDSSLDKTVKVIVHYLIDYDNQKRFIPSESLWFPKKSEYSSIFVSPMHVREMAQKIDGMIFPKYRPDRNWIEKEVIEHITNSISNLIISKNTTSVLVLQNYLKNYASKLGDSGNYHIGNILIKELFHAGETLINNTEKEIIDNNFIMTLSFFENYILIIEEFLIGFFTRIEKTNLNEFKGSILKLNWDEEKSIYELENLPELNQFLERMYTDINYERRIENKKVTPDWAIIQFLAMHYLFLVEKGFSELIIIIKEYFIKLIINKRRQHNLSSYLALRGRHTLWKITRNLDRVQPILEELNALQIQKKTRWPSININEYKKTLDKYSKLVNSLIKDNITFLYSYDWNDNSPDLFAESYVVICEEINQSFVNNDFKSFEKYFTNFVEIAIIATDRINQYTNKQKFDKQITAKLGNQTIMDLLSFSGLTFIYSSLYNDYRYQELCFKVWQNYLDRNYKTLNEEEEFLSYIFSSFNYWQKYLFGQEGFEREHKRELSLYNKLKEFNLIKDGYMYNYDRDDVNNITEPILKTLIQHTYGFDFSFSFSEIFIELYLRCRIASKNIVLNYRRDFWNDLNYTLKRMYNGKYLNDEE